MDGPGPRLADWRNLARHEVEFHRLLYSRLKSSPWLLLSIAAHGALLIGLLFQAVPRPPAAPNRVLLANVGVLPLSPDGEVEDPVVDPPGARGLDDGVPEDLEYPLVKDAKVSSGDVTDNSPPPPYRAPRKKKSSPIAESSRNAPVGASSGRLDRAARRELKQLADRQAADGSWGNAETTVLHLRRFLDAYERTRSPSLKRVAQRAVDWLAEHAPGARLLARAKAAGLLVPDAR